MSEINEQKKEKIIDVGENNNQALADNDVLPPDINEQINKAKKQNKALMALMNELLKEGIDYGTEIGISKPFLHQPGAQQLGLVFKLRTVFEIIDKTIDFSQEPVFISYDIRCKLYQRESGMFLGEGVGSCTNYEKKYRYSKDGIEVKDPLGRLNTYLKMAKKRAHVDATLNVTGATRLFTQDQDIVHDYSSNDNSNSNSPDNPEDFVVPFGYSKGKKLKDCDKSTIKWAIGLNPNNKVGENFKKAAIAYNKILNGNSSKSDNSNKNNRELTEREKVIKKYVDEDETLREDLDDFLETNEVKSINDLSEDKYNELVMLFDTFTGTSNDEFETPDNLE